jgi:hypothetical protein
VEAGQSASGAEFVQFTGNAYWSLLDTARLLTPDPHAAKGLVRVLGCLPGMVKSRTSRALARLRIAEALTGYAEGSTR